MIRSQLRAIALVASLGSPDLGYASEHGQHGQARPTDLADVGVSSGTRTARLIGNGRRAIDGACSSNSICGARAWGRPDGQAARQTSNDSLERGPACKRPHHGLFSRLRAHRGLALYRQWPRSAPPRLAYAPLDLVPVEKITTTTTTTTVTTLTSVTLLYRTLPTDYNWRPH